MQHELPAQGNGPLVPRLVAGIAIRERIVDVAEGKAAAHVPAFFPHHWPHLVGRGHERLEPGFAVPARAEGAGARTGAAALEARRQLVDIANAALEGVWEYDHAVVEIERHGLIGPGRAGVARARTAEAEPVARSVLGALMARLEWPGDDRGAHGQPAVLGRAIDHKRIAVGPAHERSGGDMDHLL